MVFNTLVLHYLRYLYYNLSKTQGQWPLSEICGLCHIFKKVGFNMTDKTDLRITKTLKAIRAAFKEMVLTMQPAEITVKELTERALVNRKTFYLHYDSIEALYEEFIHSIAGGFSRELAKTTVQFGKDAFNMPNINSVFFKYYASDALAERLICNPHYRSYFNRASAISLQLTLDEFNPYKHLPQAEQNIIFTFLCDASVDMFCKWVEDGKQIPLERVIEMTSQLLMHGQMGFVKAHGR